MIPPNLSAEIFMHQLTGVAIMSISHDIITWHELQKHWGKLLAATFKYGYILRFSFWITSVIIRKVLLSALFLWRMLRNSWTWNHYISIAIQFCMFC